MARLGKDEILKELVEFFLDEFSNDPAGVGDWLAQGEQDAEKFISSVYRLKRELTLRD
jgi:hypothetical protein